jgi:Monooxygenase af470-like
MHREQASAILATMSSSIVPRRMTAELDGEFVVFLIGMRINSFWKVHRWWPVVRAMRPMIKEVLGDPESGCLAVTMGWPVIVQYWRSFEHLEAYARSHDHRHWPVWVAFNKRMRDSRGDVGIWHETYRIAPGQYESIYSGMPAFGLGKVGRLAPVAGKRETARERVAASV